MYIFRLGGCFMFTIERMDLFSGGTLSIPGTPCLNSRLEQFGRLEVYYDRFIAFTVQQPQEL